MHRIGSILLAASLLSCRSTPAIDVSATKSVLDSLLAEHGRHAVQEDIDAVLGLYTDDIVLRSNHMEPIRGKAALRAFFGQVFGAGNTRSLTYRTEELAIHGDSAWHIIEYEMTAQPTGRPAQTDHGSVIALWIRDSAGAWRIHRDIVNSSVPLPATESR